MKTNAARTIDYEEVGSSTFKPKRKSGLGHALFKPINWASNGFKWLTNPNADGGGQYLMKGFAVLLCGLTAENCYQMLQGKESARFIPKPLINDGARIERVLPLGAVGNAVTGTLATLPNAVGVRNPDGSQLRWRPFGEPDFIVWLDPDFYIAVLNAAGINAIEAMFLRRVKLEVRQRQLKNAIQTDEQIAQSLTYAEKKAEAQRLETKLRETQLKTYGNGAILFNGVIIFVVYLAEGAMFFATSAPGVSVVTNTIYGFLSVFGAEIFWSLGESMEDRQEAEN
ncbi:hypothetical protein H6F89_28970 [Cyanobacteria bacterium FACHB-63]|nr:hypothetical protein [Cyanobacteria bacterium FACHB-63]